MGTLIIYLILISVCMYTGLAIYISYFKGDIKGKNTLLYIISIISVMLILGGLSIKQYNNTVQKNYNEFKSVYDVRKLNLETTSKNTIMYTIEENIKYKGKYYVKVISKDSGKGRIIVEIPKDLYEKVNKDGITRLYLEDREKEVYIDDITFEKYKVINGLERTINN